MCGVVGFVGNRFARQLVLDGLACLEYRGYDAAGFACVDTAGGSLKVVKVFGSLDILKEQLGTAGPDGHSAIGHTRWATHGATVLNNAHPHLDCNRTLAVVHNGIIENHHELRISLQEAGHLFTSETDSEVIAHCAEQLIEQGAGASEVLARLAATLKGSYAYALLTEQFPNTLLIARKRSPLCIGIGQREMFVGSDPLAFGSHVTHIVFLPDMTYAVVTPEGFQAFDFKGMPLTLTLEPAVNHLMPAGKGEYEHYMLKEIHEQKQAISRTLLFYQSGTQLEADLGIGTDQIKKLESILLVGCGTSYHAGLLGKFFLESIAKISTTVQIASELRHIPLLHPKNSLCIAISQSGETADTLEAIQLVKQQGVATVALSNVAYSTLVRETGGLLLTQAGREIAVASTKAFSTQVVTFYWLAHQLAYVRGLIDQTQLMQAEHEIAAVAVQLEKNIVTQKDLIVADLDLYCSFKQYLFLGRHIMYPFAREAALKFQEISYIFAHALPAGELKHGPLALIDSSVPVILFSHTDPAIYEKLLINAQAVKARGGFLVVFATHNQKELIDLADRVFEVEYAPPLLFPIALTGVVQLFCYLVAKAQGKSIDKPRNLAKSVTVE